MKNRSELQAALSKYQSKFTEEQAFVPRFLTLISHTDAYKRSLLHGHITASAWVINQDYSKVLLLHHRKLNRWLQPGGHADGNENLVEVALKELLEETGISSTSIVSEQIFDLDIHTIPTHKEVAAHDHYDVRFLFMVDEHQILQQNEESTALRWFAMNELPNDHSMQRMALKSIKS